MSCKLITYDLIAPVKNYDKLISAIKTYANTQKVTESCWIINSTDSCVSIRDYLKKSTDSNDLLFVAKLSGESAWSNLDDKVSKWLVTNLK